jgi:DNA-binding beta-propeller fold protein YncE
VGTHPGAVLVTSSGIWVVAQDQGVVHIQSGQARAITSVDRPIGLAEAPGGDVWVTAHGGSTVVRINGTDDQPIPDFEREVGQGPFGISADGDQIFTTHDGAGVVNLSTSGGRAGEPVGLNPWAVLATDDAIWVTNSGSLQDPNAEGARGSVMRFDRATFGQQSVQPVTIDVGRNPRYLWRQSDGSIWVSVWGDDRVVRLDRRTGQELDAFCTGPGSHPNGISGRGNAVYVVTEGDGLLHAIDTGAHSSRPCPKGS